MSISNDRKLEVAFLPDRQTTKLPYSQKLKPFEPDLIPVQVHDNALLERGIKQALRLLQPESDDDLPSVADLFMAQQQSAASSPLRLPRVIKKPLPATVEDDIFNVPDEFKLSWRKEITMPIVLSPRKDGENAMTQRAKRTQPSQSEQAKRTPKSERNKVLKQPILVEDLIADGTEVLVKIKDSDKFYHPGTIQGHGEEGYRIRLHDQSRLILKRPCILTEKDADYFTVEIAPELLREELPRGWNAQSIIAKHWKRLLRITKGEEATCWRHAAFEDNPQSRAKLYSQLPAGKMSHAQLQSLTETITLYLPARLQAKHPEIYQDLIDRWQVPSSQFKTLLRQYTSTVLLPELIELLGDEYYDPAEEWLRLFIGKRQMSQWSKLPK